MPVRAVSRSLRVHAKTPSTSSPARRPTIGPSDWSVDGVARRCTAARRPEPAARRAYRGSDAAAALGTPSRRASGPRAGVRLQGLERRRRVRHLRADLRRRAAWAPSASRRSIPRSSSTSRPRGRRCGSPTATRARSTGPRSRSTRPASRARRATSCCSSGPEPAMPLAHVLRDRRRPRRGARRPARRHARRAAGRRPALAPGRVTGLRVRRRAGRAARAARRRPTRARRASSACCTPPAPGRRPAGRVAVGGGAALRRRRRRTRRARWRSCAGSRGWSASRSTPPSSRTPPPSTSARSPAPSSWTRTSRPSSSASSARPTRRSGRADPSTLPSGDVLAREFQRFLRQRGTQPGDR